MPRFTITLSEAEMESVKILMTHFNKDSVQDLIRLLIDVTLLRIREEEKK